MSTCFTPEAMKFLRGLARHNDREWFEARRDIYERELKQPTLALVAAINEAMLDFAPDHLREPRKTMMRIYRDIRFSPDKRPYKTHVAAWWARRGMEKTSGGGYYFHAGPKDVVIAAGVYMPERAQLLAIRRWMSENHVEYRALLQQAMRAKKGESALENIDAQPLTRMPKGFATDDPADELLRARNWGLHVTLPPEAALDQSLLRTILNGFRRAAPVVNALNAAIESAQHEERRQPLAWL